MSLDVTTGRTITDHVDDAPTETPITRPPSGSDPLTRSDAGRYAAARAVSRDLARLTRVLAEPVTTVRRAALAGHVGFLVDQIRLVNEDLADRRAASLSRLRLAARRWSREPEQRLALLIAVEHLAGSVALPTDGPGAIGPEPAAEPLALRSLPRLRPTMLAYRWFWMLDELAPQAAQSLQRELTRPVRWVLRNGFSGGYNRRGYLMWFGGGAGPAL